MAVSASGCHLPNALAAKARHREGKPGPFPAIRSSLSEPPPPARPQIPPFPSASQTVTFRPMSMTGHISAATAPFGALPALGLLLLLTRL